MPLKTWTGLRMATTPKTLKALEVREDSVVESPVDPKLEPNRSHGQANDGPGQDQGRPLGDQGLPLDRQYRLKPVVG